MAIEPYRSLYRDDPAMTIILRDYVERLPYHVAALRGFLEARQSEELRQLLHQLKGSGTSYGFPPISTHAETAEALVLAGKPFSAVAEQVQSLIDYMEHIERYARE
jgi:HPt (histidine-containing phosphotransfer) domain-containing protein